MTAIRVVTEHQELDGSGSVTHSEIDTYLTSGPWLVVSASGPTPPSARRLVAGPGVTIVDGGPGGDLVISVTSVATGSSISWMESPSGVSDGSNKTFSLAHTPIPGTALMFYVNGVLQAQGSGNDYVLSGSQLTTYYPPRSGSNIFATYPY